MYLGLGTYHILTLQPSFNALSLSYNGGKDCLVLLILYLAVLHSHFTSPSGRRKDEPFPTTIPSIYAKPPDPFPHVTAFVESSTKDYHLDLTHISTNPGTHPNPSKAKSHSSPPASPEKGHANTLTAHVAAAGATPSTQASQVSSDLNSTSSITDSCPAPTSVTSTTLPPNTAQSENRIITFRDAFALYLSAHPSVRAIFVGTRRTDPHGTHLTHFDMTDGKWPRFMRIHPVIDWHLDEIWTFLRSPHLADKKKGQNVLDYCQMYDEGYTSLGGVNDTLRNPRLKVVDPETGRETWKPAYCLVEDDEERLGRD